MLDYHGLGGPQHLSVHLTVCRLLPPSSRVRKRSRAECDGSGNEAHPNAYRLLTRTASLVSHNAAYTLVPCPPLHGLLPSGSSTMAVSLRNEGPACVAPTAAWGDNRDECTAHPAAASSHGGADDVWSIATRWSLPRIQHQPPLRLHALVNVPWCCESDLLDVHGRVPAVRNLCFVQASCLPANALSLVQCVAAEVGVRVGRFHKSQRMSSQPTDLILRGRGSKAEVGPWCLNGAPLRIPDGILFALLRRQQPLGEASGLVVAAASNEVEPRCTTALRHHPWRAVGTQIDAATVLLATEAPSSSAVQIDAPASAQLSKDSLAAFDISLRSVQVPRCPRECVRPRLPPVYPLTDVVTACHEFNREGQSVQRQSVQLPLLLARGCFSDIATAPLVPTHTTSLLGALTEGREAWHPRSGASPCATVFAQADRPPPPNGAPRLFALHRRFEPEDLIMRRPGTALPCWERLFLASAHLSVRDGAHDASVALGGCIDVLQKAPVLGPGRSPLEHPCLPACELPAVDALVDLVGRICAHRPQVRDVAEDANDGSSVLSKRDVIDASVRLLMEKVVNEAVDSGGTSHARVGDDIQKTQDVRRRAIHTERIVACRVLGPDSALAADVSQSVALRLAALDTSAPCADAPLGGRSVHALFFDQYCRQQQRQHAAHRKRPRIDEGIAGGGHDCEQRIPSGEYDDRRAAYDDREPQGVDKGLLLLAQVCHLRLSMAPSPTPLRPHVFVVPWVPLLSCHEWMEALLARIRVDALAAALVRDEVPVCEVRVWCGPEELPSLQDRFCETSAVRVDRQSMAMACSVLNVADATAQAPKHDATRCAARRMSILTPAAIRWLSIEPRFEGIHDDTLMDVLGLPLSDVVMVIATDLGHGCSGVLEHLGSSGSNQLHVHCHAYASRLACADASAPEASSALAAVWLDALDIHAVHCVRLVLRTFHFNGSATWAEEDAGHCRLEFSVNSLLRTHWEGDVLPMVLAWLHHVSLHAPHLNTTVEGSASLHAAVQRLELLARSQHCGGGQWLGSTSVNRLQPCQLIADGALTAVERALYDAHVQSVGNGLRTASVASSVLQHLWTMTDRMRVRFACLRIVEDLYHTLVADGCAYTLCAAKRVATSTDPLVAAALSLPVMSQLAMLLRAALPQEEVTAPRGSCVGHARNTSPERSRVDWVRNVAKQLQLDVCVLVFPSHDRAVIMGQSLAMMRSASSRPLWDSPCHLYTTGLNQTAACKHPTPQLVFRGEEPSLRRIGLVLCDSAIADTCALDKTLVSRIVAQCTTTASDAKRDAACDVEHEVCIVVDAELSSTLAPSPLPVLCGDVDGATGVGGVVTRALKTWPAASLVPLHLVQSCV